MRRDFARARSLSGLYVLSYHSQLLARAEYVPTLASVARHIAADSSVWLTTADEIAEWWLARSQLDIRVARPSSNQIEVIVRNPSRQVIERTGIQLTLPRGKRIHAASVPHAMISEGMARLTVRFLSGASTLRISVALGS
jgi:hypothetical protein